MQGYAINLTPDDNGTFLVTCPSLPEVTTFGATEEEARHWAGLAISEALSARLASAQQTDDGAA